MGTQWNPVYDLGGVTEPVPLHKVSWDPKSKVSHMTATIFEAYPPCCLQQGITGQWA